MEPNRSSKTKTQTYFTKNLKLLPSLLTISFIIGIAQSSKNFKSENKDKKQINYFSEHSLRLLQSETTKQKFINNTTTIDPNSSSKSNEQNSINNFLINYYEDFPQVGIHSIKMNTTNVINNIQFTTQTKIDFYDEKRKEDFSLDLSGNLIKFLGKFFTTDLNSLSSNPEYKLRITENYRKRTVLIGIDGMVNACIDYQNLTAFKFLIENGSFKHDSRSTTEGLSGPGWSSVLCSMPSKDTGIVNNEWKAPWSSPETKSRYDFYTPVNGLDSSFPCVFSELKNNFYQTQKKNFTNYVYSSWSFFRENFSHKAYPRSLDLYAECQIRTNQSYFEYINCDNYSLDKTKNFLLQDFDLYFWYLGSLDVAGHTFSFCSTEYQSRVENINRILDDFFLYLKTLNLLEKVNIIITSDHGSDRSKLSHGKDKYDGNLMVPLFMMGPDFKSNYTIIGVTSGIDIAPTIINLYEMPVNDLWRGKVIYEALKRDSNNNNAVEAVISVKANFIPIVFNSVKSLAVILFLLVVVLL